MDIINSNVVVCKCKKSNFPAQKELTYQPLLIKYRKHATGSKIAIICMDEIGDYFIGKCKLHGINLHHKFQIRNHLSHTTFCSDICSIPIISRYTTFPTIEITYALRILLRKLPVFAGSFCLSGVI